MTFRHTPCIRFTAPRHRVRRACAGAVLALACLTLQLSAEEPAAEFMEALRQNRMHDIALEYLDAMAESPLVKLEFKETLDYERGLTLIDQSRFERDVAKREMQLDSAQESFKQFLNTRIDHPLTDDCKQQLGNLLVERARAKLQRAEKAADKAALKKEARALYDEAYRVFATAQNDLKENLASIPKLLDPKRDEDKIALRDKLRAAYLQAQLLSAAILEETADTLDDADAERKELLTKAAAEYADVYEKYRTRIAGSYAHMYRARCEQKLGKHKDALSIFTELLDQPDEPAEFRKLKVKSINYALVSWEAEKKLAEAVNQSIELLKTERPNESDDISWTELKVRMGRVTRDYVKQLQATNAKDPQIRLLRTEARKLLLPATKRKTDYQDEARRLVAEFQGTDPNSIEEDKPEPKTFAEAKDAGKAALDAISSAQIVLNTVPARIAREKDAEIRADLEKQLEAANMVIAEAQSKAKEYFALAMSLVTPDSPPEDVNIVRYFMCYLYYKDKQYHEAALVGEFVATRASGSAGARQSAKIALASSIVLYTENKSDDKAFETERIKSIADYIIKKWPEQPEAEEAINTLIPFLIQDNKLDEAMEYVNRIPEASPRRGDAELKVGQALWSTYLRGVQEHREAMEAANTPNEAVPQALEQKRVQAKDVLTAGISRMEKAGISNELVSAALSLAQISVDSGESAEAVKLMEHPSYGLIKLARDGHAATGREGVAEEIYKTALRAYIGSLAEGDGGDRAAVIGQAKQMMAGLKSTVADPKRLVGTYVGLARSLEQQIKLADPGKRKVLSEVFATFLTEVGAEAADYGVLNWVAVTFRDSLGKSNLTATGQVTPEAKKYYAEAVKTYERMMSLADQPGFLPAPNVTTYLHMQLALTNRDLGDFVKAKAALVELLKDNPMNVSVQVEAAQLYQDWAAYPKMDHLYQKAMFGANASDEDDNPKKLIWGWGRLASLTAGKKQFNDVFHRARLELATCRYRMGLAKAGAEKTKLVEKAKQDIVLTAKAYSDLGGDEWRQKYDKLLKDIQQSLAEPATGLDSLKDASPPAT